MMIIIHDMNLDLCDVRAGLEVNITYYHTNHSFLKLPKFLSYEWNARFTLVSECTRKCPHPISEHLPCDISFPDSFL